MADDSLGEHPSLSAKVSISRCEADGSQGTSRSSLVSSSLSWLGIEVEGISSDGGQAVSRCIKSGVDQNSLSLSQLGMEKQGAPRPVVMKPTQEAKLRVQ
eukprot:15328198-Ditylum_brightwellii.AAC.1